MSRYTLGICEWAFPLPGPAGFRLMKDYGIQSVQLDLGPYVTGFPLSVPEIQDVYLEEAEKNGIILQSVACSDLGLYGMVNPKGTVKGDIAMKCIRKGIEAAARMGVPIVMLTNFRDGLITDETGFINSVEKIKWACELAAEHGITIASENALSAEQNKRLIEMINSNNFGLCFDTQNPYLRFGYYVPDMICELKDHILFIHVKDGSNGNISSELLGDGDTSFAESVRAIKEIGYSGHILIENYYNKRPLSDKADNPFRLLEMDIERFREAFAE